MNEETGWHHGPGSCRKFCGGGACPGSSVIGAPFSEGTKAQISPSRAPLEMGGVTEGEANASCSVMLRRVLSASRKCKQGPVMERQESGRGNMSGGGARVSGDWMP